MKKSETFAARLKALRLGAGLSVARLARQCGTARQYLYALESGAKGEPGLSLLCRLADALGCDLNAFRG